MDHIPGPIIAAVAPRTATMIAVSECVEHAKKNIQTPTMAMVIPASGVLRPKSRNTPAIAAIRNGRFVANLALSRRCEAP